MGNVLRGESFVYGSIIIIQSWHFYAGYFAKNGVIQVLQSTNVLIQHRETSAGIQIDMPCVKLFHHGMFPIYGNSLYLIIKHLKCENNITI